MPDVASPRSWAREVAEMIRAQEVANIEETVDQRAMDLAALVRKSLGGIPPSLKNAYLDELDTHFPASGPTASMPGPVSRSPAPEAAAAIFRRRLPELSPPERAELLRQLLNEALPESPSGTRVARLLVEGRRKLNSTPAAVGTLDPQRMVRLFEVFCEAVLGLQRLVIELWREVGDRKLAGAPQLASDADFRATIARCLAGDAEVPSAMIEQEIERQRRAAASAMALLGPFADQYAEALLKPLAPEAIAGRAAAESVSLFGSREAGYWRQFCRTWESLDHAHFKSAFMECMAHQLRALNRSNP